LYSLGAGIVAITFGVDGSLVYDGNFHEISAFKTNTVDKTGVGDVYASAFAIRYFETNDSMDSGLFASAAASFVVEDLGPKNIVKREYVDRRCEILKQNLKL